MNELNDPDLMIEEEDEDEEYPDWFLGKTVDTRIFCREFLLENPLLCIDKKFFTMDGIVADEESIRKKIYEKLWPYFPNGLPNKTTMLFDSLRLECYSHPLPIQDDRIHVGNGTLYLNGFFTPGKEFCLNRLPVSYNPDAPLPEKWLTFLNELLIPEDILTLQEYIGYCLIPSTRAQKMLFLLGKGGEGKSRIAVVLQAIFGSSMLSSSLARVETDKYASSNLEYELLMVDDDMKMEALTHTHTIKAIVTAEIPVDLEQKFRQSFQGRLYVRFLAFGNGTLQALYDRSVGFFRRQIILTVKDRPKERVDDPYIADKMTEEAEGIFLWALEGLLRLRSNDYHFTLSSRAIENMTESVKDANNIIEFLSSEGYIRFKADSEAPTRDLYNTYKRWCEDNAYTPLSNRSFSGYLAQHTGDYNLEATNNIHIGGGRRCRGYLGIEVLTAPDILENDKR